MDELSKFEQAVLALSQMIHDIIIKRCVETDGVNLVPDILEIEGYNLSAIEVKLPSGQTILLKPDFLVQSRTFKKTLTLACKFNEVDYKRLGIDSVDQRNAWFIYDDDQQQIPLDEDNLYQILMKKFD
jgi:Holliday junction resolvase